MQTEETVELRWILSVIRRWWWLIAGCAVIALVTGLFTTSRMAAVYKATTTLLVAPAKQATTSEYNTLMAGERLALTYGQLLKGRSTLETTISRLGLNDTPETLERRVETTPVKDTQLIRVAAVDTSPKRAAAIADTIADVFTEYAGTLQEDRYRSDLGDKQAKAEALSEAIEDTQAKLETANAQKVSEEAELARLQALFSESGNAARTLGQQFESLQLAAERAKNSLTVVETPHASAIGTTRRYTATATLLVDPGGANLQSDYSGILASERLASTYAEMLTGPSVIQAAIAQLGNSETLEERGIRVKAEPIAETQLLRLEITAPSAQQATQVADAIIRAFTEDLRELLGKPYDTRLIPMQTEIARLQGVIADTGAEIHQRNAAKLQSESESMRLSNLLTEQRNDYRAVQQDYEELRLVASEASDTVVITDRAEIPQRPAQNRMLYVLLAVAVAMLGAFGAAFVHDYLDDSVKTANDVTSALGLSTLGAIVWLGEEGKLPIVVSRPQSPGAEGFRMLATNIRLAGLDRRLRTILVVSPAPGEGKSTVGANLAVAMARSGLQVLLVDADLRKPRLHELFGLDPFDGLTESLAEGSADRFVKSTGVEGVRILTSGKLPADPVGALSSVPMERLLEDLAHQTDLLILDSPPLLSVADAAILGARADGVLLVLRSGRTGSRTARSAMEVLQQARTHVLGAVLNAMPISSHGYYQYYSKRAGRDGRLSWPPRAPGLSRRDRIRRLTPRYLHASADSVSDQQGE